MTGFSFGFGSSNNSFKGTDTFNKVDNTTQTATPTNPQFVTDTTGSLVAGNNWLSHTDPYSYVAGANPLQTQAAATAGGLNNNYGNWGQAYGATAASGDTSLVNQVALDRTPPSVVAQSGAQNYQQYMSPYLNNVVNASLNSFDNQAGQTKAEDDLNLTGSGAFGGSGAAIQKALTAGQLGLARGQLQSGLLNQGYNTAMGYGMQDADRNLSAQTANQNAMLQDKQITGNQLLAALQQKLAAGTGMASTLANMDANTRANLTTQYDIGSGLRDIAQQYASAPLALQDFLTNNFAKMPLDLLHGQTTTGTDTSSGVENQSGSGKNNTSSAKFGFGGNM